MAQDRNAGPGQGTLLQVVRTIQLVWRLLNDSRVPILVKLIVPVVIGYIAWPFDLIPDLLPLVGQLDDIGVIFFGIRFFIEMCPADVVMEHRRAIAGAPTDGRGEYVDASYRVVGDDERKK